MTKCTQELFPFPACKRRKINARFDGGSVTSDGGSLLLRQVDRLLGLTSKAASILEDPRRKASCDHSLLELLRQRTYGIALGYEDLNDHETLRHDLARQTAVDRDRSMFTSPVHVRINICSGWSLTAWHLRSSSRCCPGTGKPSGSGRSCARSSKKWKKKLPLPRFIPIRVNPCPSVVPLHDW